MKKILIMISGFYIGGFTKSLINFLNCIAKYPDISVSVLSLSPENAKIEKDIPNNILVNHINDIQLKSFDLSIVKLKLFKIKYLILEMYYKYIKKINIPNFVVREYAQAKLSCKSHCVKNDFSFVSNYDLVISWTEGYCNYVLVNKTKARKKVGFVHPNYLEAGLSKKIDRRYFMRLDRIVTISSSCCDTLKEVFPEFNNKILCIPNTLYKKYYDKLSDEYEPVLDKNTINILTVNRIDETSKAVFRIVKLMNRLKKDGITAKWYIIGDGDDLPELIKRIKESDLSQNIICVGALNNPYPYMKASDLYIQQSYYEGRPVSVDEAMLLGTPALITNYSSAHEQVTDGVDGWIAENDELKIYEKLKDLLSHPEKIAMARENLKKKDYSKYEDCSAMINMINELTEEN